MQQQPVLTITIPTYNRSRHLAFLLRTLEHELCGLEDKVRVLVSDNASTDDTPSVIAEFVARMPGLHQRRNDVNEGADANISACYLLPATPYVWVLGDDDAPLAGMLHLLVDLLQRESPDLVYLPSLSTTNMLLDHSAHRIDRLNAVQLDCEDFAAVVHVQMTFISGLVLRKCAVLESSVREHLYITQGTSLIQLAWVLESLKRGRKLLICRNFPILATAANSGGYAVLQVFLVNHTRIVTTLLADHPKLLHGILNRASLCFLPGLVWHVRNGLIGDFAMQNRSEIDVPEELIRTLGFRWLVRPIWAMSIIPAQMAFFISRVTTFTLRQYHRLFLFPRCRSIEVIS
jgi:abequosyltransferase